MDWAPNTLWSIHIAHAFPFLHKSWIFRIITFSPGSAYILSVSQYLPEDLGLLGYFSKATHHHAINRPLFASVLHLDGGNSNADNKPCGGNRRQWGASVWQWLRLYMVFKGISAGPWLSLGFSTALARSIQSALAARTFLQDSRSQSPPPSHTAGGACHIIYSWFVSELDSSP